MDAVFSENGYHFALRNENSIELWDLRSCGIVSTYKANQSISHFQFSNKGSTLLILEDGEVKALTTTQEGILPVISQLKHKTKIDDFR